MFDIFKKTTITRTLFFVFADIILIALAVWVAFLLRFDFNIPVNYISIIYREIILSVVFIIPVFYFKKLYSFSWSYVSINEVVALFVADTISFALLFIVIFFSNYSTRFQGFPKSVIFISYFLVFVFCGALRLSKRIYRIIFLNNKILEKEKTIIVGAGDAGEQILRSILSSGQTNYAPVGFVDDNPIKQGVLIHGFKVFGRISDLPKAIEKTGAKKIIVALPSAKSSVIKKSIELSKNAGINEIKITPILNEIIDGKVSFKNLKDVDVEDLLGREEVIINRKQIESLIKNKKVLITGAAGSIGSELSKRVAEFQPELLLLLDQDETGIFNLLRNLKDFDKTKIISFVADIRDEEKIKNIFEEFSPQIVFHAAAYKHVPLMQENPDEAIKNNVFGTKVLAKTSVDFNVEKFVFISTDKAVNPTSVMGATKRLGEMVCQLFNQKNKTKFVSVRFGNVLNSRGSVIPIFREQIKKGGPVEVTHPEMQRYFMLISEACLLVMQAGAMGNGGEVYVLDMGKPVKIIDLAKDMIKLSGFEPDKDIAIVFSGIRPGEKLFEEILTAEEGTESTQNKKIFMAKLSKLNLEDFENKINNLEENISFAEKDTLIPLLKNIVPHYNSFVIE
jgi:FlaA1/EpsC-like NDP-sugar epimerase